MADAYVDYNVVDDSSNDGLSESAPKNTLNEAETASSAGDTVFFLDGTHTVGSGEHLFDANRNWAALNYRRAILRGATAAGFYASRTSGNLPAGSYEFNNGLIFDGENKHDSAHEVVRDQNDALNFTYNSSVFRDGEVQCLRLSMRQGVQQFNNIRCEGSPSGHFFVSTQSLKGDGSQTVDINGIEIVPDGVLTGSQKLIEMKGVAGAGTLNLFVKGFTAEIDVGASANITGIDLENEDNITINGARLIINADDNATSVNGILIRGVDTSNDLANGKITNCYIEYNSPAGYGLMAGQPTTDSYISNVEFSACTVVGKYYDTATPHNMCIGQGCAGSAAGLINHKGYVGLLLSRCDDVTVTGGIDINMQGPAVYAKGTQGAVNVNDRIIIVEASITQKDLGILSAVEQGAGSDNQNVNFNRCVLYIEDLSKIHSIFQVGAADQMATFNDCVIFVEDTTANRTASTGDLFCNDSTTPNATLAEFNATASGSNNIIEFLPAISFAAAVRTQKVLANTVNGGGPSALGQSLGH